MEHTNSPGYGLWSLVIINSIVFIFFAFSFFMPQTKTDWRTFGAFSAFIVALFVEMYGFPLTIYLLSGWLGSRYPLLHPYQHDTGHLWHTIFGMKGDPHFDTFHILSSILIVGGFFLLAAGWRVLYKAQQSKTLATDGPYKYIRHPQYVAFTLVMFGFLLQWPTIPTLVMFPILVFTYVKLAHREERAIEAEFGERYREYAAQTPRYFPHIGTGAGPEPQHGSKTL